MKIVGIDPGQEGALALYDPHADTLDIRDMPTFTLPKSGGGKRTELDLTELANIMDAWAEGPVRAFIEQVGPTPQMGVSSAFSFGGSYMAVRMAVAAHFIQTEMVVPQRWKRAFKIKGGAIFAADGQRKKVAKTHEIRAKASELLPQHSKLWTRAKDEGRAEAALIALYGARFGLAQSEAA